MDNVVLEGDKVRLRDWRRSDIGPLRDLLGPARSWHDTNGPYFGRPTAAEADAMALKLTKPTAALPDPRTNLAVADLQEDRVIGQVTWYWESDQTDRRRLGLAIYDERHWGVGSAPMPCACGRTTCSHAPTHFGWTSPRSRATQE